MGKILTGIVAAIILTGCGTVQRPPERIRRSINTINRYYQVYHIDANACLKQNDAAYPETIGIGDRLKTAIAELDRWANEQR